LGNNNKLNGHEEAWQEEKPNNYWKLFAEDYVPTGGEYLTRITSIDREIELTRQTIPRAIEIILGFSLSGKDMSTQIADLLEYLSEKKVVKGIRDKIKANIDYLVYNKPQSKQEITKVLRNIEKTVMGHSDNLTREEKQVLKTFMVTLSMSTVDAANKNSKINEVNTILQDEALDQIRSPIRKKLRNNVLYLLDDKPKNKKRVNEELKTIEQTVVSQSKKLKKADKRKIKAFINKLRKTALDTISDKNKPEELDTILQTSAIENIQEGIQIAKDYWDNDLMMKPKKSRDNESWERDTPKLLSNLNSEKLTNQQKIDLFYDFIMLARKTRKGCYFVKTLIASLEAQKIGFEELKEDTKEFTKDLIDTNGYTTEKTDEKWRSVEKGNLRAKQTSRTKSINRIITKLLNRPKFDVETAINDGVGIRVEVANKEDALKMLVDFGKRLNHMGAHSIVIRTRKLLADEFQTDKALKTNSPINGIKKLIWTQRDLPKSEEFFEDARIVGIVDTEQKNGRQFEIQFVRVGNTNESGLSHHSIWEQMQLAKAKARIQGYITEEEINEFINKALTEVSNRDELMKEVNHERKREGKKELTKGSFNSWYSSWKKRMLEGITKRFMDEAVEYEKGKFIFARENKNYKYRLLGSGELGEKDYLIQDACFKKWFDTKILQKYSLESPDKESLVLKIPLGDVKDNRFLEIKYNSIEDIDEDILDAYEFYWRENKFEKYIKSIENQYFKDYFETEILLKHSYKTSEESRRVILLPNGKLNEKSFQAFIFNSINDITPEVIKKYKKLWKENKLANYLSIIQEINRNPENVEEEEPKKAKEPKLITPAKKPHKRKTARKKKKNQALIDEANRIKKENQRKAKIAEATEANIARKKRAKKKKVAPKKNGKKKRR